MHGARTLVVTTLLAVIAVAVIAGGATGAPVTGTTDAVTTPTADTTPTASTTSGPSDGGPAATRVGPRGHSVAGPRSDATGQLTGEANASVNRTQQTGTNMTVIVAPGSARDAMLSATSPSEYGPNAVLSARPRVTLSDTLVLRITAPGLGAAVQSQSGNDTTSRFVSLVEGGAADLLLSQLSGPSGETPRAIDTTDTAAMSVVPVANNTYDVVMDLSTIDATLDTNGNGRADDNETVVVDSGDTYRANFTLGETRLERTFGVFPVAVIFEPNQPGNNPTLRPAPNQTIHARTTLAPGTRLTVEVTVEANDIFRRTQETTVVNRSQSQFRAAFDLRDAPDGVDISVAVSNDDEVIGATRGTIPELRASVTLPQRADQRDSIPVSDVSFSQGGFLIVRDGGPSGQIVANRYLAGGNYSDLSVLLVRPAENDTLVVTAYADLDADRVFDASGPDRPYRRAGSPVRGSIQLPPRTPTPEQTTPRTVTTTPTATATPTARRVTTPTTTATPTPEPFGGDTPTPGFTPYTITGTGAPGFGIGVTLTAILVLVAVLAGRRRES